MSSFFAAGLALALTPVGAGASAGDMIHSVRISNEGTPVDVTYRAVTNVSVRQIGSSPPTRVSNVRCVWTGRVALERRMTRDADHDGPPAIRVLPDERIFNGSRHGDCMTNRRAIDTEMARRTDQIRPHLAAAAQADHDAALAELKTANSLASRD